MKITVHGDASKPEYAAAQKVAGVLSPNIEHIDGEIAVRAGLTLFGQRRRDVDVLVMGRCPAGIPAEVWDATVPRSKIKKNETRPAMFFSFVFCIEVKDHCFDKLVFENNSAWVLYRDKWSDATAQSEEQKYCLLSYLENLTGWRPFVCNFLWFRNLEPAQLPDFPNNFLAARFSFEELFSKAAAQMKGFVDDGVECFHATKQARAAQLLEDEVRLFTLFDKYKAAIGNLTRLRLEKITRDKFLGDQSYAGSIGQKLVLVRGRAGTGKTIKLLHIAHDLCVRCGERVLVLTYNRLLVSDIRRMLTLSGIDSDVDHSTIEIETIHAFLQGVLRGFSIEYPEGQYLVYYADLKRTLLEYLDAQLITAQDIVEQRRSGANDLAWDKVLIDEGQDWPEDERRILFALFEPRNLVVASGIGQLVRASDYADWTRGVEYHKPIVYEKRSLRQKKNLCQFLQSYASAFELPWDLEASDELLGGRVIISVGGVSAEMLQALDSQCHKDGNQAYDFLFLAPPSLTMADGLMRRFALREQFERHGIRLWDGIPRDHRAEFPIDVKEHRVVTYESSRGLEGWVVACLDADAFFDYKLVNPYMSPTGEGVPGDLGLANPDQKSQRIVHDWMLIAFTRAIDTLLIGVKDAQHPFSRKLLSIAGQLEDFVEVKYVPVGIT